MVAARAARAAVAPILAALLAVGCAAAAAAADVEVSASLEPRNLAAGDLAELAFEARGGMFDRVQFRPAFELENFELVAGPMQSSQISIVNGATSRSFRLSWRLRALAAGPAAVRDVAADFGGRRLELPTLRAAVRAAPADRDPAAGGRRLGASAADAAGAAGSRRRTEPQVFLRAEAAPLQPWTGQQVTYSLWIYTQVRVDSLSLTEPPAFPGFWVDEVAVPDDSEGETVDVDGELYLRKLLLRRALFPLHPGRYELAPSEISLLVNAAVTDFFGPAFARPERLTRRSQPIVVEARPLPPLPPSPPAPAALAGFEGLVGNVALTARLSPPELAVGEAATLDLALTGGGHLAGTRAPQLAVPPGLKALAAAGGGGSTVDGTRVGGSRRWSYALVPERAGVYRLPPVEIPYFDPAAGEYRLASSEPLVLSARPGDAVAEGPAPAAAHPIRSAALPAARGPGWRGLLPWLFALPWGVVLVVALARRHTAAGRDDADRPARHFAQRLAAVATDERAKTAAAAIEGAWRELLAARWKVAAETPAARWRQRVGEAGADPAAAADLGALVDDLHYLRYAPQLSAVGALRSELIDRSRSLEPRLR